MFEKSNLVFVYVETPLHAGTGRGLGGVDLPIQRERMTNYPLVQASSLKGRLRAEARPPKLSNDEWLAIFGPEGDDAPEYAGALSPGDAKLLLFPVRSLSGVFAWTTSTDILARFMRDASATGVSTALPVLSVGKSDEAFVSPGNVLKAGDKIVLEEFAFTPKEDVAVKTIAEWLANNALPNVPEYKHWRDSLPTRLIVLPDDDFKDFVQFSTEVVTRIRIKPETKTVDKGALWTEENLPTDTLLYAPLHALSTRAPNGAKLSAAEVLTRVAGIGLKRIQLGGDETVGRGTVYLRFGGA